jgi:hypothetical protein
MKTAIICGIFGVLFLIPASPANASHFGNCQCSGPQYRTPDGWHCRGQLTCPNRKLSVHPAYKPPPPPPRGTRILQTPAHPAITPAGTRILQTPAGKH